MQELLATLIREGCVTEEDWSTYNQQISKIEVYGIIIEDILSHAIYIPTFTDGYDSASYLYLFTSDSEMSHINIQFSEGILETFKYKTLSIKFKPEENAYKWFKNFAELNDLSIAVNPGFHCIIEDVLFDMKYMADIDTDKMLCNNLLKVSLSKNGTTFQ